jgi:AraC-like DNA-binding protein
MRNQAKQFRLMYHCLATMVTRCSNRGGSVLLSSTIRVANDIDQYAMSFRPSDTEHTIVGRGSFAATVTQIDLHRLRLKRGKISHASIAHGQLPTRRQGIFIGGCAKPAVAWKGVELMANCVGLIGYDQPFWYSMPGPSQWGSMTLPAEDLASLSVAMVGRDLTLPRHGLATTATPARHAKLLRLHAAAGHLAEHAPNIIHDPEAARGLEQALIEAMFGCMAGEASHVASDTWGKQTIVLKRFRAALEANIDQPLYMPELCQTIGVPERTLRNHCYNHLGMSPKRYLLLRRLNLAHRALRAADPSTTTVTEIATSFGFWELGRFAVEYRAWCGESPSASLNRAPGSERIRS